MISLHLPAKMSNPLVSIGVPVRNGGAYLADALQILVDQTYKNIEIIISDNNSSDDTSSIIERFAKLDKRIVVYTQSRTLTASENFRFVFERSHGEYFMWAACDDRRDTNYIEVLVKEMMKKENASLAFSSAYTFSDYNNLDPLAIRDYDASLKQSDGYWKRIYTRSYIRSGYLHIYGLIKRNLLIDYQWPLIEIAPDRPLIFYLSCRGDFVQAYGTYFYCYKPVVKKTIKQRAEDNFSSKVRPFAYSRLNYICAKMACHAEKLEGRRRNLWLTFLMFQLAEIRNKSLRLLRRLSVKFSGNRNDKK